MKVRPPTKLLAEARESCVMAVNAIAAHKLRSALTLLGVLVDCARQRGEREVLLHAQMSAAGFYTRAGFTTRGSPFDEAGIAHVEMVRAL